ncbi:acetyl-CoA carboxylase biotin carboxylase subunit family protein [Thermodesulfobacteriota bacterium]
MSRRPKILVVGTTADYIHWIRTRCPGRALFLTDPDIRKQALEPDPDSHEEILCNLNDYKGTEKALKDHLERWGFSLDGITSYDCESMELAAFLGDRFSLNYPTTEAINNCRNKYRTKRLWQKHDVPCPDGRLVQSADEAVRFLNNINAPCVLKPVSGSGSELIFCCETEDECRIAFNRITNGLSERQENRLYKPFSGNTAWVLIEECIRGDEFSCDIIVENERIEIIRLSKKIRGREDHFGTIKGYILPASLPTEIDVPGFHQHVIKCAGALGLSRALCTLDFMVLEGKIFFLEMAPRPGGDCLPFLLRRHNNIDTLIMNLDFAQNRSVIFQKPNGKSPHIGLRLHASKGGILKRIDAMKLITDPRICEIHLPRIAGHIIRMPPEDYDSWLLGHVIFEPYERVDPGSQCMEILDRVVVEIG